MNILHRYLLKEVLATLAVTVGIFTAVLMMGNAMKEVLALVVKGQASLWGVTKAFGLLIPFVVSFSLPMGLLTSVLLVFGRFSADQELTAAKASGISLIHLVTPTILFSILICGLSAWINLQIAPQCRTAYKDLVFNLAKANPSAILTENTFVTEVPGHVIYIGQLDKDRSNSSRWIMHNILLNRIEHGELIQRTRATHGEVSYDQETKEFMFILFEAQVDIRADKFSTVFGSEDGTDDTTAPSTKETDSISAPPEWMPMAGGEIMVSLKLNDMENQLFKPKLSYLTFGQLRREQKRHGEIMNVDGNGSIALAHYATQVPPETGLELAILRGGETVGRARFNGESTSAHLVLEILRGNIQAGDHFALDRTPLKVQLHRQVSFSFAVIGFTLVGIPLGIRSHRRETTAGIAMALVLVLLYYGFVILGQALEDKPQFFPQYIVWIPVFLFQAIGGFHLWRANRGI